MHLWYYWQKLANIQLFIFFGKNLLYNVLSGQAIQLVYTYIQIKSLFNFGLSLSCLWLTKLIPPKCINYTNKFRLKTRLIHFL